MAVTQLESFYEDYNKIYALTFSGRFVDRRMLVDLDESTWASVTNDVVNKLTDAVIDRAVTSLPPPYYEENGAWLSHALKSRRDHLMQASRRFYQLITEYIDIRVSDKREFVEVRRLDDERVEVTAYKRDK